MKVVVQNSDGQWDPLFASQFNFLFAVYTPVTKLYGVPECFSEIETWMFG